MKYYDLKKENIEFKHLLSAPAPIGRILNYIYLTGNGQLYHANSNRKTTLQNSIGDAWATEFMMGLGLIALGEKDGKKYKLHLTPSGIILYNLLKTNYVYFNEKTTAANMQELRQQMDNCNKMLYIEFKKIFTSSYPFLILQDYLETNGYSYARKDFINGFFEYGKKLYEPNSTYNRASRTPTGQNRVTSLIQLCEFFEYAIDKKGIIIFNSTNVSKIKPSKPFQYTKETLHKVAKKQEIIEKQLSELCEKFGEEGNVLVEMIVRNNELQRMFRHNLIVLQKSCVICGIKNESILVGSHIKPSSKSNVFEKCDHNNGLLLCGNHDKAFDRHLITFDYESGQIKISKHLTQDDVQKLGIDINYKLDSSLLSSERKIYLKGHNTEFDKKENK